MTIIQYIFKFYKHTFKLYFQFYKYTFYLAMNVNMYHIVIIKPVYYKRNKIVKKSILKLLVNILPNSI